MLATRIVVRASRHRLIHIEPSHASSGTPQSESTHGSKHNIHHASAARDSPAKGGFADQVGSQSYSASGGKGSRTGQEEEVQPPGVLGSIKSALGFKTSSGDVKQNRGGGAGVTGTENTRQLHTSAFLQQTRTTTQSKAPSSIQQKRRAFSTSVRISDDKSKHSAESYFKDVDSSPAPDTQTHRVDAGAETSQRPHEAPSGEWSRASTKTHHYENVNEKEPYNPPRGNDEQDTGHGYGGIEGTRKGDTSKPGEGPEGEAREGRKP